MIEVLTFQTLKTHVTRFYTRDSNFILEFLYLYININTKHDDVSVLRELIAGRKILSQQETD